MMSTTSISCERCLSIHAQINRQVPIPPPEQAQMEQHLATCEKCRVDTRLSELMTRDDKHSVDELADRRRIEWAISYARQQSVGAAIVSGAVKSKENWSWKAAAVGALTVAALMLAGFYFFSGASHIAQRGAWGNTHALAAQWSAAQFTFQQTYRPVRHRHASPVSTAGEHIGVTIGNEDEQTFATMASGIDVSLEAGSEVTIVRSTPSELRIRLTSGVLLASVNPQVPHPHFVVETSLGTVEVKGTIFSVSVDDTIHVEVLRGKVAVTCNGRERYVTMNNGFELNTQTLYAISAPLKEELSKQLALLERAGREQKIQILSLGEGNALLPDDAMTRALHQSGTVYARSGGDASTMSSKSQKSVSDADNETSGRSLDALLLDAREKKTQRNWAGALEAYESIVKLYPSTIEAASARIAAGNLRLKFGDAEGALNHFNEYLAQTQHVSLKEEAMFGKIKSLRRLNDESRELTAMREFVKLFPHSLHTESMEKRITMLDLTNE